MFNTINRKLLDRKPNIEFVRTSYRVLCQAHGLRNGVFTPNEIALSYIVMQEIYNNNMLPIAYNGEMELLLKCKFVSCEQDKPHALAKIMNNANMTMISKQFSLNTMPQMKSSGLF